MTAAANGARGAANVSGALVDRMTPGSEAALSA
jgi:hypothetical protein